MKVIPPLCNAIKQLRVVAALILFFLSAPINSGAQTVYTLTNSSSFTVKDYKVLVDASYSFKRIITDANSSFKMPPGDSLVKNNYWIKIAVYNPYPNNENYVLSLSQPLNFTLYQSVSNNGKWIAGRAGPDIPGSKRKPIEIDCILKGRTTNFIYLKVNLSDIYKGQSVAIPTIVMEKEVSYSSREDFIRLSYFITCVVLISFSCYNLYIFVHLKDRAYLYYVIVQAGALLYFTADKAFFNIFLPFRLYNLNVRAKGIIYQYNINSYIDHLGVALIFWGFIQFTRAYLCTKEALPGYDKLLKIFAFSYAMLEVLPGFITVTGIYYIESIAADNILIICLILVCLATGFAALRYKVKAAKPFLLANLAPAMFAAGASIHILIYKVSSPILPEMAILSQMFSFAVALVARIKSINDDLQQKAVQAVQMEADIAITEYKRLLVEEENKNITLTVALEKEKNTLLQQSLEANQRELMGNSLYIHQKNKLLADLKIQMKDIDALYPDEERPDALRNIQSTLKDGRHLDEEWNKFKLHFEQVHPSFFAQLEAKHPSLTKYELRLYAYFHINLSTKEVAALLNIMPGSVRKAKTRLFKKINDSNLSLSNT